MIDSLRAALFYLGLLALSIIALPVALLCAPLPYRWRYLIIGRWTVLALWWLRLCCGLDWRAEGLEHIPAQAAVILCKHQSALETLVLQRLFPPQVWVLKRELLWIPFYGWALAFLKPIAIRRSNAVQALKQTISQGCAALQEDRWIVIFPEGTRVTAGDCGTYNRGGARLAIEADVPVIPVAVDTGLFWPRNTIAKRPGVATIAIGPPIATRNRTAAEVTAAAQDWIEARTQGLLETAAVRASE